MPTPPPTPAESFAALLRWLTHAVVTRSAWGLPAPLINLIIDRIRGINQRVAGIVGRVVAGRYAFRRVAARRRRPMQPRQPNPLPTKFGWLLPLVPDAVGSRAQLENLFRDPAMAELMAAAPVSLGRPLRSLCHMLGLRPPTVLLTPAKPRAPRKTAAKSEAPPQPQPAAPRQKPRRRRWSLARICGPPHPA